MPTDRLLLRGRSDGHPALAELARRASLHAYAEQETAKASEALDHGRTRAAAEHAEEAMLARLAAQAISTDGVDG